MKKYTVTFTQHFSYEVKADDENSAAVVAYDLFEAEMLYPVANTMENTIYDEVEVCEIGGDQ